MTAKRTAFFISDRTGITAEILGKSLLTQFPHINFTKVTLPFIDTLEKARDAAMQINQAAHVDSARPLVFGTLLNADIRTLIASCNGFFLDLFETYIGAMEAELNVKSSPALGLSHGIGDHLAYKLRIDAVNFALSHDDGVKTASLGAAEIILLGVSRSGKTPTCLYLALQYGVQAANFPLTPDDFSSMRLPASVQPFRDKLFGLSISPERLHQIRSERKPNSEYASLKNCQYEVRQAVALLRQEHIPFIDSTAKSIEEIATTILHETGLARH